MNSKFLKSALCLTVLCAFNDSAFSSESSSENNNINNNNIITENNLSSNAQVNNFNNLEDIKNVLNNENENNNINIESNEGNDDKYKLDENENNNINIEFFNEGSDDKYKLDDNMNMGNISDIFGNDKVGNIIPNINNINLNKNNNPNTLKNINTQRISSNIKQSFGQVNNNYNFTLPDNEKINYEDNLPDNDVIINNNMNNANEAAIKYNKLREEVITRIGRDNVEAFDKFQGASTVFVRKVHKKELQDSTNDIKDIISNIEKVLSDDKQLIKGGVDQQLSYLKNLTNNIEIFVGVAKNQDNPIYQDYKEYYYDKGVNEIYSETNKYIADMVKNNAEKYQLLFQIQNNNINQNKLSDEFEAVKKRDAFALRQFRNGTAQKLIYERNEEINKINEQIIELQKKIELVKNQYDTKIQNACLQVRKPYQDETKRINERHVKLKEKNEKNYLMLKQNKNNALQIKNDLREKLKIYINKLSLDDSLPLAVDYIENRFKLKCLLPVCNIRITKLMELTKSNNEIKRVNNNVLSAYGDVNQFNNTLSNKNNSFATSKKSIFKKALIESEDNNKKIEEEDQYKEDEKEENNNNINNEENNNNIDNINNNND